MKRKRVIVVVVVAAILLLAFLLAPFFLNAERFRPMVEARLSAALARPVQIGKLSFSWLAGGIHAHDITIADDPAFGNRPFLQAQGLNVSVDIWTLLLHRQVNIRSITVNQPQVRLIENRAGRWNISTLGATPAGKPAPPAKPAPAQAPAAPPPQLSLQKVSINDGQVVVEIPGSTQTYTAVNVKAENVSADKPFPLQVTASTPGGGGLKLQGTAGPLGGNTNLMPFDMKLNLAHLDLGQSEYLGKNSALKGVIDLETAAKSDGHNLQATGSAAIAKAVFSAGGTPLSNPVNITFGLGYNLDSKRGTLSRGDVRFRNTSARMTGNFETRGATTSVAMALAASGVSPEDVEKLLPALAVSLPRGASLRGGSASTTLAVNGPVETLVTTGPFHLQDLTITGFDLGGNMRGIAALAGINTGSDTHVQSLDTQVRMAPSGITFDNLKANIAGLGLIDGGGVIGADHSLNFRLVAHLSGRGGLVGGILQQAGVGQLSTVPFAIQGTTTDPRFVPNVGAIIGKQPGQQQQQQQTPQKQANPLGGFLDQLMKKK